ncbi:RHS repeat domain-containing protein [Luteibacter sahnii]|uniref:RHS repeat domain-containing protein n=1 Tax=Luteibacter sahnii TaxID=3021977 RepID=UPI002A69C508|nr:RHS repeat-associated core domain-containing protein [Luteibacter sp. PPL193]MDY1549937.1 RHS repeat-associated core domain-containing protein [Luteibacter sp. PPL193]
MTVVQQNGATAGSYLYNASGERVQKTVGSASTRFVYDEGSQMLSELGGTNARDYVAVGGVPMAVADGASLGFITADGLGSPRVVTSAAGAVLWAWPYAANPFGEAEPVSATGYVLNPRFPGQYQDNEAGLKYNVHRSFDAAAGRYLQSDPIGLEGGMSTYAYALGDPLAHSGTLGLDVWVCRDPAFDGKLGPIDHYWLKTDTQEAGMGTAKAGANAGNQYDFLGSRVETVSHGNRSGGPNAECRLVPGADEASVNRLISPGRPLGRFVPPVNYCHSFVRNVLEQSNGQDPFDRSMPIPSPYLPDPYK